MHISFHGAAHTVTGSQHLLEINDKRILLDCGLYQGKRAESNERNSRFPFDPASIDVLILSHAHIDHSGNIPQLVKKGFKGDIICTPATRDLCVSMLQDSGYIQEKDAEFYNTKIRKRGEAPIVPLYTRDDAIKSLSLFTPIAYERTRHITREIEMTFLDAGHMLGSAITILHADDEAARRRVRLVFSGDLGHADMPIVRDPSVLDYADILLLESTYGDRLHPPSADIEALLAQIIVETAKRGGAVIIPSFAVERTQQLIYSLQKLVADERIPALPMYVDSSLATDVTQVFRNHPDLYDEDLRQYIADYHDQDPFGFANLSYTRSVEDSKALNELTQPFIVISASGMCEAGRILHHLRNRIENSKNTILFVGWQAPHTLGRRILESAEGGPKQVRIFGEEFTVRAQVSKLDGMSGHADANELIAWVKNMYRKPHKTFLVHGEPEPARVLANRLHTEAGLEHVGIPELHLSVSV
jgi:metallo-beta-lactamase family protein